MIYPVIADQQHTYPSSPVASTKSSKDIQRGNTFGMQQVYDFQERIGSPILNIRAILPKPAATPPAALQVADSLVCAESPALCVRAVADRVSTLVGSSVPIGCQAYHNQGQCQLSQATTKCCIP
jgi:hypothetical protein